MKTWHRIYIPFGTVFISHLANKHIVSYSTFLTVMFLFIMYMIGFQSTLAWQSDTHWLKFPLTKFQILPIMNVVVSPHCINQDSVLSWFIQCGASLYLVIFY